MDKMQMSSFEENLRKEVSAKVVPSPTDFEEVKVEMLTGEDCLIDEFAHLEYEALERAYMYSRNGLPFTEDDFKIYCRLMILQRIQWVVGPKPMFRPEEQIIIPSFLYVVSSNIGKVIDVERGLTFIPYTTWDGNYAECKEMDDKTAAMKKKEITQRISKFLQNTPGYEGSLGYKKDKRGELEFMAMQVVSEGEHYIAYENAQAHPVYAFIASIILTGMDSKSMTRKPYVKYADINLLKQLLWEFTSL